MDLLSITFVKLMCLVLCSKKVSSVNKKASQAVSRNPLNFTHHLLIRKFCVYYRNYQLIFEQSLNITSSNWGITLFNLSIPFYLHWKSMWVLLILIFSSFLLLVIRSAVSQSISGADADCSAFHESLLRVRRASLWVLLKTKENLESFF